MLSVVFMLFLVLMAVALWPNRTSTKPTDEAAKPVEPSMPGVSTTSRAHQARPSDRHRRYHHRKALRGAFANIPRVVIEWDRDACAVCGVVDPVPRFKTPSTNLCRRCVEFFEDDHAYFATTIHRIISEVLDDAGKPDGGPGHRETLLQQVLNGTVLHEEITTRVVDQLRLNDLNSAEKGWWWYMRAYHLGLVSDEENTYPKNWSQLAHQVRRRDGMKCHLCGLTDVELHVHHMIPLTAFGTNDPANLVTLCYGCHRAQHPDVLFDLSIELS